MRYNRASIANGLLATSPTHKNHAGLRKAAGSLSPRLDLTNPTADQRLRSEQHLCAIFENSPECIKIVARDGTLVSMNQAGLSLVEAVSPSEVVGRSVFDLIAPEFRDVFREMHRKVCAGEKGELEYEIHGLKGIRRWMHTRAAPIPHPVTGEPAHLAITRDITERKQAEQTIKLNEERLRLATFSGAITLFEQDSRLRYTWLYPLKPEYQSSLGKSDSQILPNEEGALLERIKTDVMRTGRSQRHIVSATFPNRKTWYDLLISPRRNAEGQVIGVGGAALDITDRKAAEEALRKSELRWRTVAETLPNLVWSDLPDGHCDWLSTQWGHFTGIPEKELLGLAWLDRVIHPDDRERTLQCWQAACADQAPYDLEYRIRRHDGQYHWFKTRGVPVRDDHGKIVYWFGTCTDIQDLKQAEASLSFLSELSNALTASETATEIATAAARLLCRHLDATRVNFSDIDPEAGEATVFASERAPGLKDDRIPHKLNEYLPDSILKDLKAGRVVSIDDVRSDPRIAPFAHNYAQWHIGAMILAPHLTEQGWRFLLVLHKAQAHCWQPAELKLVPEITARVHNRIERARALHALFQSEVSLQTELADSRLLQAISAQIVFEPNSQALYEKLVEAAAAIMRSDFASLQMFCPQRGDGELRLLAHRGFTPTAAEGWQWVSRTTPSTCGEALRRNSRVVATNIESCEFLGTEGRAAYRSAGIASAQTTPLFSRAGQLVGMISTHWSRPHQPTERELRLFDILARQAADVIEQRRAESMLRESEQRFRNIFNQSTAGIAQVRIDGRFILVNERFCEITGYSSEELKNKTCGEITLSEDQDRNHAMFENALRDGKPYFIEKRYLRPDGSIVWVRNNVSQMKDADGQVRGMLAISIDITEQKQAQESAARLAAIVEHSDDAILSTDLDGIIHSWNRGAERLYGYTSAEAIGRLIDFLAPEGLEDEQVHILERIRQGQTIENFETVRRRKNGSVFNVSLTVSPVKDSSGRIIGVSKVARDITEKVRAHEILEQTVAQRTASLEEALAQMEDFTYSVSHDLRAPARSIRGLTHVAIQDFGQAIPPQLRGFLERISNSAHRMEQLISDILDYSRVSRAEVKLTPVQLDQLVAAIISERPDMQPQRAQIRLRAPLGSVLAHEPSLAQAITNLLANAVKFVPPGVTPNVEVWTEFIKTSGNGFHLSSTAETKLPPDGHSSLNHQPSTNTQSVRIWVTDNGIGINPKYQHRLFNVFERLHNSPLYEGTGIGLAIVRKAAEKMGGKVGVISDGHSGSSFWIELPAISL